MTQSTTDRLMVYVSDEKIPLALTDEAIKGLQVEAAVKAQEELDAITDFALNGPDLLTVGVPRLAQVEQWRLTALRENVTALGLALDALWYCRPTEYEDGSDD